LLALIFAATLFPGAAAAQSAVSPSPIEQAAPCASVVTVRAGESLAAIAARLLGNQNGWTLIVAATNARASSDTTFTRIANPDRVTPGTRLCIPAAGSGVTVSARPTPTSTAAAPAVTGPAVTGPAATAPATATPVAAPAVAATASATDTLDIDPQELTLAWLAEQETPGSDIVIEEVLAPGSNYSRYLTSYLSEGLKIYAYMTVPQGAAPATGWPVVVFNHGYIPPEIYRSTERYIAYQDAFARNGYIVFRPDYRGHGFSEGEARGGYGRPDYTLDVLNALASIERYEAADPARMGMWGHSMGGYITLRAMLVRPEIKAGVIWAGVVASYPDMIANWTRRPQSVPATIPPQARRWRQVLQETMGTPAENPAFWASISANSYLDQLSGPVQLHHGTADADVPVAFSQTLEEQIVAAGGGVEYYEYPGDDHNLSGNLGTALSRSVAFFDEHVKNAE
jgi:dienelactone hydrolase